MNKILELKKVLSKNQVRKPENFDAIVSCLAQNKRISFFSWKIFCIKLIGGQPMFDNFFNPENADRFIQKEQQFLKFLTKNKVLFDYYKFIPDELPIYFWGTPNPQLDVFTSQLKSYFQNIYPPTKVVCFSEILATDPNFQNTYNKVFQEIYQDKTKISKQEFAKEIQNRKTMYSDNLPMDIASDLAKKAFALFAAESAILYKLSQKTIPNLVLLAGKRSTNTYKYEFYKSPKNRPVLPKLFVI